MRLRDVRVKVFSEASATALEDAMNDFFADESVVKEQEIEGIEFEVNADASAFSSLVTYTGS